MASMDGKEMQDLLRPKVSHEDPRNGVGRQETGTPPDGGLRAICVVLAAFITNGVIFGIINSYSIIYSELLKRLQDEKVTAAEVKASLCGTLTIGCTFALSPVSGTLSNFFGMRATAFVGGVIATLGLLSSSFAVNNIDALCFTYGILYGLGASLCYTPSLGILCHYFKKYLGIVNGFVCIGSSVFTVMMPPIMDYMIAKYGLKGLFRILAVFGVILTLCGLMYKPVVINVPVKTKRNYKAIGREILCFELWKIKSYRLWALLMPVALFGYFVPYIHIKKFIEDLHLKDVYINLPLQGLAVSSAIGRLFFGFISDKPWVNKILVQQITFYIIGILTIILAFAKVFWLIVVIAVGMGFCEGGFIALIGPVAFELCGHSYATQGIGIMLGLAAYPLCFGPPLAAYIYGFTKNYTIPFAMAGTTPIVGATLMFLIHLQLRSKKRSEPVITNGHALFPEQHQNV